MQYTILTYVIFIGLLLIPAVPVIGLIYVYKKLPRFYFLFLLIMLVVIVVGTFYAFKIYERRFNLSFVPDALHVTSILYNKEETWGWGPGGNSAAIRVYSLPGSIADEISHSGIEFFNNLPPNQNQQSRNWRGSYTKWYQTPIGANGRWKPNKKTGRIEIYEHVCIDNIDKTVMKQASDIVNNKGNYYAYDKIGLIVVSPSKKMVLYMFCK